VRQVTTGIMQTLIKVTPPATLSRAANPARKLRASGQLLPMAILPGALLAAAFIMSVPSLSAQRPLSLQQAVAQGLANAPESHTSQDHVQQQQAQIAQARLRPNPRLFLQSEDLRPWANDFSFPNSTEDYGYLSQSFELGGKRGKRIAYAKAGVLRAQSENVLAQRQIAAGIADAYWAAVLTRDAVLEWQHQLADFDRIVQYQSDRVHAGAAAGVDLLRTQVERDRITLSLAQAQRDAEAASLTLARRTALPLTQVQQLSDPLEAQRPVAELPMTTAVEQRPDVAIARDALQEARENLRLQHANAIPNADLLGGYKRDVGTDTLYAGLQIDLPFFNRNQGAIALATADIQLALDQLAFTRLSAAAQIALAVSNYQSEQALVRNTLPTMLDRAVQNAAIISDAYRSGGTDLLRYLDAERILIDTHLQTLQTWAEYQRAVVALQLAYGEFGEQP
jgi:cobalt-zinc-cadmium efflux system outer membrane protein